jgi:hypothetical protein
LGIDRIPSDLCIDAVAVPGCHITVDDKADVACANGLGEDCSARVGRPNSQGATRRNGNIDVAGISGVADTRGDAVADREDIACGDVDISGRAKVLRKDAGSADGVAARSDLAATHRDSDISNPKRTDIDAIADRMDGPGRLIRGHCSVARGLNASSSGRDVIVDVYRHGAKSSSGRHLIIGRPDQKGSTGRGNRMFVEGVLWIVRTGSP